MRVASSRAMATHAFRNDEEREISRGGRATAIWILCIGLFMISFGILGANFFTGPNHAFDPENVVNEQFRGLGGPRGAWIGVRYGWG